MATIELTKYQYNLLRLMLMTFRTNERQSINELSSRCERNEDSEENQLAKEIEKHRTNIERTTKLLDDFKSQVDD